MLAPDKNSRTRSFPRDIALDAVLRAGEIALGFFRKPNARWNKADGTPVSDADLAVNTYLEDVLRKATPSHAWRSEESEETWVRTKSHWLADPIDGTKAFLEGQSDWCISLALVDGSESVLGIIHAPVRQWTFIAVRGEGSTLNGVPIATSEKGNLEGARILSSSAALRDERWARPLPKVERIALPSLALRLAQVARGEADAALALVHKHDWDLAAGDIIVREAGGFMTDLAGQRLDFSGSSRHRGFLAANPRLHAAILQRGPEFHNEGAIL